jgi:nucleoside-diphosphate-sugar epimerase
LRIAITGATGFLGQKLVIKASQLGHNIRALVHPTEKRTSLRNIRGVWIEGTLANTEACQDLLEDVELLIHLAAWGVQSHDRVWNKAIQVNIIDSFNLLQQAIQNKVKQTIAVGTCLEYQGQGNLPHSPYPAPNSHELCLETSPLEPADSYGATKAAGGILLRTLARELGMPMWYLRLASMYGPGDNPQKFLSAAIRAARAQEIFPMTPGEQVREWLRVDDAVEAILAAAMQDPPEMVSVVNIGTGIGLSFKEIATRVFQSYGAPIHLIQAGKKPYRHREPQRIVMDVSKAQKVLKCAFVQEFDPRYVETGKVA